MIAAIITILILGGGAFGPMIYIDEARDNAKTAISDEDQQTQVRADLKEMKGRTKDYMKAMNKLIKGVRKEFGVHAVDSANLDAQWNQLLTLNKSYSEDIMNMRFELRDQLTREQWAGLFPAQ